MHKVGTGTVKCEVAGSGTAGTCASSYLEGTELVLYATPGTGLVFRGWIDAYCSFYEAEPCELTLEEATTVTAEFGPPPKYPLTVKTEGTGTGSVKCEVVGSGVAGACAAEYQEGTELNLYASPGAGSLFVEWTDGFCSFYGAEPCEELRFEEEGITVAAKFDLIPKYPLTVKTEGTGTGSVKCEVVGSGVAGACAAEYQEGTELNLYASPGAGSLFVEWTDGFCSFYGAEPCEELRFEEEGIIVAAKFDLIPKYPFTVKTEGTGTGSVKCEVVGSGSSGPCAAEYPEGTNVRLVAAADPGSKFVVWSGECDIVAANECKVEMSEEKIVAPVFEALPGVSFTVIKSGTGTGTVACNGGACASSYREGSEVTLDASPASGSTFAGWSGGGCSGPGACTVTVQGGTTVTATFDASPTSEPKPQPKGMARAAGSASVSGRHAALKLICSGGPCRGALKLTAKVRQGKKVKALAIGTASFSLPAGSSETLTVKLSAAAKNELDRSGVLKATLSGTGIAGSTVKLKLGRR